MTDSKDRLDYMLLAKKRAVVGFLQTKLPPQVIRDFEDAIARGREWADVYNVQVDHSVRESASIRDLWNVCLDHFTPSDNPYYPYMFVVLDERTAQDGTVLLYHDREPFDERKVGDLPEELRITPASIPTLLSCLDIHHQTIPEIIENHMPDGEEETWFDDVPYDHSKIQLNAHVPTARFRKTERPDGLTELHIDDISKELPGFPSTAVRVCWFGQLPEEILVQKFEEDGKVATTFAGVEESQTFQVLLE